MRVSILSESSADEAATRILIEGILGVQTQQVSPPPLRTRGWPSVRQVLPTVLKYLHYRTDAEALVLVVDSNHSPVHNNSHDDPGEAGQACRLCELRGIVDHVVTYLTPVPNRLPLKTALGLAVPAIEAWYLCGRDAGVTEAAWVVGMREKRFPYSKKYLKEAVYGTDRPSLNLEIGRAVEEADRLAQNIDLLEQMFPGGFGALASDVRSW